MTTILETQKITKRYPGIVALDAVDFDIRSGEVHILFGENGAGKSTLISMLAGSNSPSQGRLLFDGQRVEFASVREAQQQGIFTVFQEFSLIPTMNVAENMFLTNEPKKGWFIDRVTMRARAEESLAKLGFPIDPDRQVSSLSRAEQQMIEIAKALMGNARVLILDEPTASLTDREVVQLFAFINDLKAKGVGIIYISHRTQEFHQIGDRVSVLRDGKKIATVKLEDTTESALVNMMTGREISEIYPKIARAPKPAILEVDALCAVGVKPASFDVRPGEILGVAGLVGSGKSRLWRVIMGLGHALSGKVRLGGIDITNQPTKSILKKGVHYLSPDRKYEGLDLGKEARENLAINLIMDAHSHPLALLNHSRIRQDSDEISDRVELHQGYREKTVSQLSGGNQQKVLFGKCFAQDCALYIFDEPTVGVDMGTRTAIYQLIKDLAESGKAVVIISSDLPEAMNLSHRLLVMAHGHIAAILEEDEINEETVLGYFFEE